MATVRVDKASLYKKRTIENLALLHKIQPMLTKIAKLIFEENALEKTTQNLFYNVTYYLLFIIDPQVHSSLTWPLYDTKAERAYKSELSAFISDSASKGFLTDVRPSYLVNPTSFKVTVLVYQLSVLAVKRLLTQRIKGTEKQNLYDEVTEKFNNSKANNSKSFIDHMENLNYEDKVTIKLTNFLAKEYSNEKIAEMLRTKIIACETKISKAKFYTDNLINEFVTKYKLDEYLKNDILQIKDINKPAAIFDDWLKAVDEQTDDLETTWNAKVLPLMEKCRNMHTFSEEIVKRSTGQIAKSSYTLVYDPKTDEICTVELQNQVNNCQKQILRNIQQNGRLSFPNLIRAYTVSMCYLLNNVTFGDELYDFNKTMEARKTEYIELCSAYRGLLERLKNNEKKLKLTLPKEDVEYFEDEIFVIPAMPDVSGIKMKQNKYHNTFDAFTPLNIPKRRFNLLKRGEVFTRPPPKSMSNYNTYHAPKDDFLKTLLSCRVSSYDRSHTSNTSVISNIKANETIAECSSGFTKQQIERLLSTKKKSCTKKLKNKNKHQDHAKIKRAGLFNESILSNESTLFRSYSSPNLLENRESKIHKSNMKKQGRKLSIMAEDSPPQLDVSGIACLNSNYNTPVAADREIPEITITPAKEVPSLKFGTLRNIPSKIPLSKQEYQTQKMVKARDLQDNMVISKELQVSHCSKAVEPRDIEESFKSRTVKTTDLPNSSISPIMLESHSKTETPKTNTALIAKTGSLEKIINRFKQFRSNIQPLKDEVRTIVEEKENFNTNAGLNANRNLLPDLLSPSCSSLNIRSNTDIELADPIEIDLDEVVHRVPRVSLGTMLGVDHTFLDQYDLSD